MKSLKIKTSQEKVTERLDFLIERLSTINNALKEIFLINKALEDGKLKRNTDCLLGLARMQTGILHALVNIKFTVKKSEEKTLFLLIKHATNLVNTEKINSISIKELNKMKEITDKMLLSPTSFVNLQPHDNNY